MRLSYLAVAIVALCSFSLKAQPSAVVFTGSNAVEKFLAAAPDAELTTVEHLDNRHLYRPRPGRVGDH